MQKRFMSLTEAYRAYRPDARSSEYREARIHRGESPSEDDGPFVLRGTKEGLRPLISDCLLRFFEESLVLDALYSSYRDIEKLAGSDTRENIYNFLASFAKQRANELIGGNALKRTDLTEFMIEDSEKEIAGLDNDTLAENIPARLLSITSGGFLKDYKNNLDSIASGAPSSAVQMCLEEMDELREGAEGVLDGLKETLDRLRGVGEFGMDDYEDDRMELMSCDDAVMDTRVARTAMFFDAYTRVWEKGIRDGVARKGRIVLLLQDSLKLSFA